MRHVAKFNTLFTLRPLSRIKEQVVASCCLLWALVVCCDYLLSMIVVAVVVCCDYLMSMREGGREVT